MYQKLLSELSSSGRRGVSLPPPDVPVQKVEEMIPSFSRRKSAPRLPEISEIDAVRHFTNLSQKNMSVDTNFYPLGSCTMKYNPKINDELAKIHRFAEVHPYEPQEITQGLLQLLYELEQSLCEICGMDAFTLQPAAGAHGEFVGLLITRAYHLSRNDRRTKVLVPDSSHGTNPASAALCGFQVVEVRSNNKGRVDLAYLKELADSQTAALMLTNPNTLGLFEDEILKMAEVIHKVGGLLYYDGANLNPLLGISKPGKMGFDIVHLNLHKTFSTPHGAGGPGAGPVGVKARLAEFLPIPRIIKENHNSSRHCEEARSADEAIYILKEDYPRSIGKVRAFYGNIGVLIRAYVYIRALGAEGLREAAEAAILNANYLRARLEKYFDLPYDGTNLHEFVLSANRQKAKGVTALDIAKRLLDYGIHAPTIYFPLVVPEALMIEPTETESLQTLDYFVHVLESICKEIEEDPEKLHQAPFTTPISRPDEVRAARQPILKWQG
jgi:glycine dehydrogenase subunit 2